MNVFVCELIIVPCIQLYIGPTTNNQLIIVEIVSRLSSEMETVSLIGAPNIKVDTDTAVATNVAVVGQIILLKVHIFSSFITYICLWLLAAPYS